MILKLSALVAAPPVVAGVIVEAVELLFEILTVGVPVKVRFVDIAVFHKEAPEPVTVILPVVPKVIALVLALLELNKPQDKVKSARAKVPRVWVNVFVSPKVNALPRVKVPAVAS